VEVNEQNKEKKEVGSMQQGERINDKGGVTITLLYH
jgi:hypothetical protein